MVVIIYCLWLCEVGGEKRADGGGSVRGMRAHALKLAFWVAVKKVICSEVIQ